jgi:hypothetical protein
MPSVVMLNVVMLNVVMLNVVMLNVVMFRVLAPIYCYKHFIVVAYVHGKIGYQDKA